MTHQKLLFTSITKPLTNGFVELKLAVPNTTLVKDYVQQMSRLYVSYGLVVIRDKITTKNKHNVSRSSGTLCCDFSTGKNEFCPRRQNSGHPMKKTFPAAKESLIAPSLQFNMQAHS